MPHTPRLLTLATVAAVAALTLVPGTSAEAALPPALAFDATPSPAFGDVAPGDSVEKQFRLRNNGGASSAALTVSVTGDGYSIPAGGDLCTGVALGPKKTCTVTVRFAPTSEAASLPGRLTASAKKPTRPASLDLTGSSTAPSSPGCAAINASPGSGFFDDLQLDAGDTIHVVVTSGYLVYVLSNDTVNENDLVDINAPASVSVPADGVYDFTIVEGAAGTTWTLSCVPAAPVP